MGYAELIIRLSNRTKLKSVLAAVGYKDQPTFVSVFKRDLWKRILLKYWQDLIASHNLFLFDKIGTAQATLRNIFDAQSTIKPKQAIYFTGLQLLAKEIGARELRKLLEVQSVPRTWQRISKDLRDLSAQARDTRLCEYIRNIEECLNRFEPYSRSNIAASYSPM